MKALNLELIEMSDWYNELLKEKPKPFDPAPYRERQAKLREKIEARRQEIYESKLTEQFVKVEKPLQALLVKFNQTSGFLKSLEPGTVCPLCHRAVTAEEHIACEVALKSALEKYKVKGTELRLQQKELEVLEKRPIAYRCYCSRERMERALISLGPTELKQLLEDQGEAELTCRFCDNVQHFSREDLERMLAGMRKK